jgi:hypothetical protein
MSALLLVFALMGFLESEEDGDSFKYCYYDDGRIVTVELWQLCPLSIP